MNKKEAMPQIRVGDLIEHIIEKNETTISKVLWLDANNSKGYTTYGIYLDNIDPFLIESIYRYYGRRYLMIWRK